MTAEPSQRMRRRRTKKNLRKKLLRYAGGFGLLLASIVYCVYTIQLPAGTSQADSPLALLSRVPIPELPEAAATLVRAAPVGEKTTVITNTLWAVGGLARPGVMPYVVGALCRDNPGLADVIAATAIEMNGAPVMSVISAATTVAPEMIDKIAVASFAANPETFQNIAMALALDSHTSNSSTNIMRDLCQALPNFETFVDTARTQAGQVMADADYAAATNLIAQATNNLDDAVTTNLAAQSGTTNLDDQDAANEADPGEMNPVQKALLYENDQIATNKDVRLLYLTVAYAEYAITNSGDTIEDVLTNAAAGADLFSTNSVTGTNGVLTNSITGTNLPPDLRISTSSNKIPTTP